jgi:hypothetical protein
LPAEPPIDVSLSPGNFNVSIEEAATATDVVDAAVVSLDKEATNDGLSVEQRDADLRDWVAKTVFPAFIKTNALTLGALGLLALADQVNIAVHLIAPGERIVGSQVIMALLGATTVQVGAIAAIIARYLFPGRSAP